MTPIPVEPVAGHPALRMTWPADPSDGDVQAAFQQITALLDGAETPQYVVVDLSADPRIPIMSTFHELIFGPLRHPKLAKWLVVGHNRRSQVIASLMATVDAGHTIYWFDDEEEVGAYLNTVGMD